MHVASYLKNFMFDPKQIHDKVATLSGGQANRLLLAKALVNPGNLLILDEPTKRSRYGKSRKFYLRY